jgi:hypothetical protein
MLFINRNSLLPILPVYNLKRCLTVGAHSALTKIDHGVGVVLTCLFLGVSFHPS